MATLWSSTLPNASDTVAIAKEKLLQIENGNGAAVANTGTVTLSSASNDVTDTKWLTLEKILNSVGPAIPAGFTLLVDGNGNPILDGTGAYQVVPL